MCKRNVSINTQSLWIREQSFDLYGGFFEKIVRTGLRNKKNPGGITRRNKTARTGSAKTEKGKGRKIERAREIENNLNQSIRV